MKRFLQMMLVVLIASISVLPCEAQAQTKREGNTFIQQSSRNQASSAVKTKYI